MLVGWVKFLGGVLDLRQTINDLLNGLVVLLPPVHVRVDVVDKCPRRRSFHLVRRNICPAPVVNAEVVVEPADLELALGELLGREVLLPDVVGDGFLCSVAYINLEPSCEESRRSASERVYLFCHTGSSSSNRTTGKPEASHVVTRSIKSILSLYDLFVHFLDQVHKLEFPN